MASIPIYQYHANGYWNSYDEPSCLQIESARLEGSSTVTLTKGQYGEECLNHAIYEVLLYMGLQRNTETGTCRVIRRLQATVVGTDPVPSFDQRENEAFDNLFRPVSSSEIAPDMVCNICLGPFEETEKDGRAIRLPDCRGHYFHIPCIQEWLRERQQCPYCKAIYGVITGNCPPGEMHIHWMKKKLPGHTGRASNGTWQITWDIREGFQDASHAHPGIPFPGTVRIGYLPDSEPFRRVLKMLQVAWKRRLMFTVGTSLTRGCSDVVIWNGIHIRTEWHDRFGYGWPAPSYLESVTEELRSKGITEDQIS